MLNGNQSDFSTSIHTYETNAFRTAMGLLHNKKEAEEISRDIFIKVYPSISLLYGKPTFSAGPSRTTIIAGLFFFAKEKAQIFPDRLVRYITDPIKK